MNKVQLDNENDSNNSKPENQLVDKWENQRKGEK